MLITGAVVFVLNIVLSLYVIFKSYCPCSVNPVIDIF